MPREVLTPAVPVANVTLMEDRGHVVRRGKLVLRRPGPVRCHIEEVAPVLADKTLTARIVGAGARVTDVRVQRQRLVQGDEPPDRAPLFERAHALTVMLKRKQAELALLDRELADVEAIAGLSLQETLAAVSRGNASPAAWSAAMQSYQTRERELRQRRVDLVHAHDELRRERQRLEERLKVTATPRTVLAAAIDVDLEVDAAGEPELEVSYVVPGACWRPYHTATLRPVAGGHEVLFSTDACCWQNTGEDWRDVQLAFSTERPSLGVEPPPLTTERLTVQKKAAEIAVEVREEQVFTAGLGGGKKAAPEVLGIDDGGEPLALKAAHPADVPADGRPYRTLITSFTSPAKLERVLCPELSPAVIAKTTQPHRGERPILAGPVDLVRDGGLVGRTSVLFIAAGEEFALGWGPDGALRAHRERIERKEETKLLSSWTTQRFDVEIKLSNLAPTPAVVAVTERVPVSEIEKVKLTVDPTATSEAKQPDADGMVRWEVEVPALGRRELKLRLEVKKHSDVVGLAGFG